jgi:hypothetical protein
VLKKVLLYEPGSFVDVVPVQDFNIKAVLAQQGADIIDADGDRPDIIILGAFVQAIRIDEENFQGNIPRGICRPCKNISGCA